MGIRLLNRRENRTVNLDGTDVVVRPFTREQELTWWRISTGLFREGRTESDIGGLIDIVEQAVVSFDVETISGAAPGVNLRSNREVLDNMRIVDIVALGRLINEESIFSKGKASDSSGSSGSEKSPSETPAPGSTTARAARPVKPPAPPASVIERITSTTCSPPDSPASTTSPERRR
jgi:hypothetical protein